MSLSISRRSFLKTAATASAAGVLAACVPAAPSTDDGAAAESIKIVFVTTESSDSSAVLYDPIKTEFQEEHPEIEMNSWGSWAPAAGAGTFAS